MILADIDILTIPHGVGSYLFYMVAGGTFVDASTVVMGQINFLQPSSGRQEGGLKN